MDSGQDVLRPVGGVAWGRWVSLLPQSETIGPLRVRRGLGSRVDSSTRIWWKKTGPSGFGQSLTVSLAERKGRGGNFLVCTSGWHELRAAPLSAAYSGGLFPLWASGSSPVKGDADEMRGCRPPCELLSLTSPCRVRGQRWSPGVLTQDGTLGVWGIPSISIHPP